tara:strand:+ start:152240 stop:152356 length:117 start_codon:yes stop_codon:yes gene_type:complete
MLSRTGASTWDKDDRELYEKIKKINTINIYKNTLFDVN